MTAPLSTPQMPESHRQYFVDEAGDGVLFNAKGRVLIGTEGCSRYFMLGILDVQAPDTLNYALESLRANLLSDPYFRKVPSMQVAHRKTTIAFHAKDDIPEVRREVFALLRQQEGLRFFAVVRDKFGVLREAQTYVNIRYHPNLLYDQLVRRLFKDRLHKDDRYTITFALRGRSDRTQALQDALKSARKQFEKKWQIQSDTPIHIQAVSASQQPCLQAVDYMLWALQRCYERREDRYLDYVWSCCHLIHDVDDHRKNKYGVYYSQKTPLVLEGLPPIETDK
ncbi:MAG: DUF3800 domain-containing protein [Anaerolineae bacterium]|nr:DUF3800 domain-containing protein [Anaerolineae bacterium]